MLIRAGLWGSFALLLFSCERSLQSCLDAQPCLGPAAGARDWLALGIAAGRFLAASVGSAWVLRTAWLAFRHMHAVNRLPLTTPPDHLRSMAEAVGIRRLRFIDEDVTAACCAGILRPSVYISRDLLTKLSQLELRAVLIHEMEHARGFEPRRRAAWRGAAEIGFFVPLLGWARVRDVERGELRADRRAIKAVGAQPVASALWTLGSELALTGIAGFSGTMDLRVSQLAGDALPRRLPQPDLLLSSVLGTAFALALVGCIAEIAGLALG